MKRLHLLVAFATVFSVGCASGKMGKVDQEMAVGSLNKSTPIFVESINAKETAISGDKSGDKKTTDGIRSKIEDNFNKQLVDALNKKGFNAKIATGPVKSGVVLSGNVTKIENGSAAARYFVGMGAGSANMFTNFKLEDRTKATTLAKFEIIGTSGGSSNMGSFLDRHLADSSDKTADYLDKSIAGKPVK